MKEFLASLGSLALVALLALPTPTRAHAVLESAEPADSAVLAQAPALITMHSNEPVSAIYARVLNRDGHAVTAPSDASSLDNQLLIRIGQPLAPGPYMVTYRVVSADTHAVGGAYPFMVGQAMPGQPIPAAMISASPADESASTLSWNRLIVFNRALHLAALLIVAGGALFLLLIEHQDLRARRVLMSVLLPNVVVGAVTALLAVGLQGGLMEEARLDALLDGQGWRLGAGTTRGTSSLLACLGLLLMACAGWVNRSRVFKLLLSGGLLSALASMIVAGHGATVEPRWMVLPAWIVHTVVAAFWIGSLPPLLIASRSLTTDSRSACSEALMTIGRFSTVALPAVMGLLVAGAALATIQIGPAAIAALDASSSYVIVLAVKLALVGMLLALAALNRYVLVPRLVQFRTVANAQVGTAGAALRRSISVEIAVGIAVIVAAAALSQQHPPASLRPAPPLAAGTPAMTLQEVTDSRGNRASIRIQPEADGRTLIAVRLTDSQGRALRPVEVHAELANPAAGIESLSRKLERADNGSDEFRYSGRDFVVSGHWSVEVEALINDFEQTLFATEVNIPAR